jgi:PERQ amino acid-rich with GYF domain-containing protein
MRKREGERLFFSNQRKWDMTTIIIDQPALTIPRKLSLSSTQGPLGSPRDSGLPSPRTRGPLNPGFDGILNSGETWVSRRRASESGTRLNSGATTRAEGDDEPQSASRLKIDEEEEEEEHLHSESIDPPDPLGQSAASRDLSLPTGNSLLEPEQSDIHNAVSSPMNGSEGPTSSTLHTAPHPLAADDQPSTNTVPATSASQPATNPAGIEWSYLDPQGLVQGTTSITLTILRLISFTS